MSAFTSACSGAETPGALTHQKAVTQQRTRAPVNRQSDLHVLTLGANGPKRNQETISFMIIFLRYNTLVRYVQ